MAGVLSLGAVGARVRPDPDQPVIGWAFQK
jgi:hypothetical protein